MQRSQRHFEDKVMIEDCRKIARKMWVIFSGQTDMPWLKILKDGYRHCFVLIHDGNHWISVDPMAHYMDIIVHNVDTDFDFPTWLEKRGHIVVPARFEGDIPAPCPIMPFSCVEVCKRMLGIRRRMILTPWGLYRYLTETAVNKNVEKTSSTYAVLKENFMNMMNKGEKKWEV